MNKFKINDVGLDTSTIVDIPPSNEENDFIVYTELSANNDYLFGSWMNTNKRPLITYIENYSSDWDDAINLHLVTLGRSHIDILLLPASFNFAEKKEDLEKLLDSKLVKEIGIRNPQSVEQLDSIDFNYKYIGLNCSPLEFNYSIHVWAEEKNKSIIGFNPFGGYISAARSIDAFSVPYLLGFVSTWCDTIILSGRDINSADKDQKYLRELIGKDSAPKYILKKNVNRLVKPLKSLIGTSIKVTPNLIIPYKSSTTIPIPSSLIMSLGDPVSVLPIENESVEEFIKEVREYIKLIHKPENCSIGTYSNIVRSKVTSYLSIQYPKNDGWMIDIASVGGIIAYHLERKKRGGIFKKYKVPEEKYYYLGIADFDKVYFDDQPQQD